MSSDHDGQADRARRRIQSYWQHNRGPLTGAFSIVDAYLALFGDVLPEFAGRGGADFIPKATSANAVYAALEQVHGLDIEETAVPPLPQTGIATITYGPEKLGISLWNAVGRVLHHQRIGQHRPVIVALSDGELQSNIDAAARLAGAKRLRDLVVLLDVNGLQSCYPVAAVDPTVDPGPDGQRPIARVWSAYGWAVHHVDGHNRAAVAEAVRMAIAADRPSLLLLQTVKGRGLPQIEGKIGRFNHGVDERLHDQLAAELTRRACRHPVEHRQVSNVSASKEGGRPVIESVRITPARTTRSSQVLKQWLEAVHHHNPGSVRVINTDTTYPFDPQLDPAEDVSDAITQCVGINEIGAFNIARGISQSGGFPVYLSPSVHLEVCADEFRLAGLHGDSMLVVGFNTGSYLGHWGPSYISRRDLETYRAPGVTVVQPATTGDLAAVLNSLPDATGPTYLRLPHRLLDLPVQRQECTGEGMYRMAPGRSGDTALIVATGAAVAVAMQAARLLRQAAHECSVLNWVRLTSIDPAVIAHHVGDVPHVCVLADGETTSLELAIRRSLSPRQSVTAIDLSRSWAAIPRWWLRQPIDHVGYVAEELAAVWGESA